MILETERLYLREFREEDYTEFRKVLLDRVAMKHFDHEFTEENVKKWIEICMEDYTKVGHSFWAVIRKEDDVFLGDCGITLQEIDGVELPEVGFHFIREFWGKGYATEASKGCIEYGFKKLGLPSLYSYMTRDNEASQKVAERSGMKLVKTYTKDGKEITVYRIDKE